MTTKKYYEILGITENATDTEIKKAYRKEALQWHPDKNQDRLEEANERFKLISEAYEVLKDPQQRSIYDKYGDQGFKNKGSNPDFGNSSGYQSFHFSNPEDLFRQFFGGQDPFSSFFGGGDPFGFGGSNQRRSNGRRSNNGFDSGFGGGFGGGFGHSMFGNSFFDNDDDFGMPFGGGSTFSSFSSSSFGGNHGGNFVSTSQTTQIINGKKTIIKETTDGSGNKTVEKTTIQPDGTKTTETIVNGKQQSVITDGGSSRNSNSRLRIEDQSSSHHSSKHSSTHSSIHSFHNSSSQGSLNNKSSSSTKKTSSHHHFF